MTVTYNQPGVRLARATPAEPGLVRELQRDLRRLGYLRRGLDGQFGPETERAVRSLQHDLLFNDGQGKDGSAPVPLGAFNRGRITAVSGVVDHTLAACVEEILEDPRVPQLPRSDDPENDNRRVLDTLRGLVTSPVPVPFLLAVLSQESGLLHFRVPTEEDPDDFIVVGLDRNDAGRVDRITSRGYGVGQFTLFHHPPRPEEVKEVMLDPTWNVERAIRDLKEKFEDFVVGNAPGTRADDRLAEAGAGSLRPCRFHASDPRFQKDCRHCAAETPRLTVVQGTPLFPGSPQRFHPTEYHPETRYREVPDRAAFGCDWPYAVRRYNGSGVNSYHYQAQVLRRLVHDPALATLLESP